MLRAVLPPLQTLDGFGILAPPPPTAQPVTAAKVHDLVPSLDHPPGYYGAGGSPHAVNVLGPKSTIAPLPALPAGTERLNYESESAHPLKSWLLLAALALLFADIIAVILLQAGGFAPVARGRAAARPHAALALAVVGAAALMIAAPDAQAQARRDAADDTGSAASTQAADERAIEATSKVTIGYVLTGDQNVDEISRLGLDGLGRLLAVRTAVEPGRPMGVNILTDEIAFYPVLYWPVLPDAKALPEATLAKIDAYMKQGGLIIFDTQDYGRGLDGGSAPGGGESALAADHRQARRAAPRAGAGEPRADQGLLSSAQLPRPLGRRAALGRGAGRLRARIRRAARAFPTASPRSSSRPTTSRPRGRWMRAAGRSIRPSAAARTSARWPSAPASTSSCTR